MGVQVKTSLDAFAALLNMPNDDMQQSDALARLSAGQRIKRVTGSTNFEEEYDLLNSMTEQSQQPALSIAAQNRAAASATLADLHAAQEAVNLSFREGIEQAMLAALSAETSASKENRHSPVRRKAG